MSLFKHALSYLGVLLAIYLFPAIAKILFSSSGHNPKVDEVIKDSTTEEEASRTHDPSEA